MSQTANPGQDASIIVQKNCTPVTSTAVFFVLRVAIGATQFFAFFTLLVGLLST
jgi:hypothetical protein